MGSRLRRSGKLTVKNGLQNIHFKTKDMRIKINDKIYRLKEIESGVDSLMELVEEPKYKDGDFVVNVYDCIIIFKNKTKDGIYDHAYLVINGVLCIRPDYPTSSRIKRYATEEEKQILLDALVKEGKRWNAEKLCVEDIPSYKKGDFLVKEYKDGVQYIFILDYIDDKGLIYYHCYYGNRFNTTCVKDDFGIGKIGDAYHKRLRYATDSEKELLIAELSKVGKRWNADKKCIEDIPKRKFKKGDKVMLKSVRKSIGGLLYLTVFDQYIGNPLTVSGYTESGNVFFDGFPYRLDEEWLEPYVEELKKGDLAIFWNDNKACAFIGKYNGLLVNNLPFPHKDNRGNAWNNAIKFESKKQYRKLLKGEI